MKVFVFVLMVCCISRVISDGDLNLGGTGCATSPTGTSDKCDVAPAKHLQCSTATGGTCECKTGYYNSDVQNKDTKGCDLALVGTTCAAKTDCTPNAKCEGTTKVCVCDEATSYNDAANKKCPTKVNVGGDCGTNSKACKTTNAECKDTKCACKATFYKESDTSCKPRLDDGDDCTGKTNGCKATSYCKSDNSKCAQKIKTNQGPCTGTTEGECLDTDYCKPGASAALFKCQTKLAGGATCTKDEECKTGTCNAQKQGESVQKCKLGLAGGATCTKDVECKSGICKEKKCKSGATVLNTSALTVLIIAAMTIFFKSG